VPAGTALALGLHSATSALLLLFSQETTGLYAWGQSSLTRSCPDELLQFTAVILAAVAGLLIIGRRLDVRGLGDDASRLAGADPRLAASPPSCCPPPLSRRFVLAGSGAFFDVPVLSGDYFQQIIGAPTKGASSQNCVPAGRDNARDLHSCRGTRG
jgi:hypothetical protein